MTNSEIVAQIKKSFGLPNTSIDIDPAVVGDFNKFVNELPSGLSYEEYISISIDYMNSSYNQEATPAENFSFYLTLLSLIFEIPAGDFALKFTNIIVSPIQLEVDFIALQQERESTGKIQLSTFVNLLSSMVGTSGVALSIGDLAVGSIGAVTVFGLSSTTLLIAGTFMGGLAAVAGATGIDIPVSDYIFDYYNINNEFDNGKPVDYSDAVLHHILLSRIDATLNYTPTQDHPASQGYETVENILRSFSNAQKKGIETFYNTIEKILAGSNQKIRYKTVMIISTVLYDY